MHRNKRTVETIRLLLYVAWADGNIAPEEYDYLLRKARNAAMSDDDIQSLDAALRDRDLLHQPDMEVLKPHRDEVLKEVRSLIRADYYVHPAETKILDKIITLLND